MKKPSAISRLAGKFADPRNVSHAVEALKSRQRTQAAYEAPAGATEASIAAIWSKLLAIDRVGRNDNFFQMGGHSLLATQMLARVRDAYQVELPLKALFEAPVLAAFAQRVGASLASGTRTEPLEAQSRGNTAPLSYAQQRLWFLDQLSPGDPFYNIPQRYRLVGRLNPQALQQAIDTVVQRQEALRTTFQQADSGPVQVIAPQLKLPVHHVDLLHLPQELREPEALRLMQGEAAAPFDLATGPLLRVLVIRLADDLYELVLNTHHIIYDRWSHGILMGEIATHYRAACEGRGAAMQPLTVQYADFAIWQRHILEGGALDQQVAYWKERLAGAPAISEFPTDRPRKAADQHHGAIVECELPGALVAQMRQVCREEGATLFMGLLSAFNVLLSRYSGLDDLVVGSPIANRTLTEIEPLIGFFVGTLALRTDLSGNPTFRELLGRVRETCLGAYANEAVPFERLVEELQPERSLSHNPIFQVMFALQPEAVQSIDLPDLQLQRRPLHSKTALVDVAWFAFESANGVSLRLEYNTELFDAATIERMVAHFQILLEAAVADPGLQVSKLPLLAPDERHTLLSEFNAPPREYPRHQCLPDFFEQQAARTPDALAVIAGTQRLYYRDLEARANQLAHVLRRHGVGPEVLVGTCLERGADMLVGVLAILKAGGAYVPLDPNYPSARLAAILTDSAAPLVITQRAVASALPAFAGEVLCLDTCQPEISRESALPPRRTVQPENLAYVLFTSGSTGRPKGVALEHRSAAAFIHWAREVFAPEALAGVLFSTSICFDLSVFEMFVPLSVGGAVIIAENALYLPTLPARDEVTLVNTVPSAMAELVRMHALPTSVTVVNLAGEALSRALVDQIYETTSVAKLYNLYGPTEDTTYSTYTLTRPGTPVTIGRPIANTQAYVLDGQRNLAPIGVPGELYLAGDGLARGYFGRADLTAERFVPDPFSGTASARMYRTGDSCRWLASGELEYLGRIDHQVKVRGFRIELGEIEALLSRHPAVQQTVVVVREERPGDARLVAYVVFGSQRPVAHSDLRTHLSQHLPDYMIPGIFVTLAALPLTPNGKVDRQRLPAPAQEVSDHVDFVAPRSPAERVTADIWAEVLRLPKVSVVEDFFSLGGHSLLATQVISRLRQAFGIDLPLRALFENPTVAGLAQRAQTAAQSLDAEPIRPISRDQALPLSFAQQRLWFLDQLEPGNPLYNIPWALRISGSLEVGALERGLNQVVQRHEALRTLFVIQSDQPVQLIQPALHVPVGIVDLTPVKSDQQATQAQRLTLEEAQRPFDLSRGPLLRATLLRLDAHCHILLLSIHHIVSDRWSLTLLAQELAAAYAADVDGRPLLLPELPIQYPDFASWQRQWLTGTHLSRQLDYWKDRLRGVPPVLELPTDRPRPAAESFRGGVASIAIGRTLTDRLHELSRDQDATLFMTLFAAFCALLTRCSGQEDVLLGTPIANRNRAELEGLIGFFANTLPLRLDLSGNPSFSELVARAKESALGAYAHQDLPFERLVEELRPERNLSYNPVVQVFFVLQNAPLEGLHLQGLQIEPIDTDTLTAKGDLFFSLAESPSGLRGRLEYSSDLFDAATIERLLGHYQVLLEAVVADPSQRLSKLPVLTAREREQLLVEWNATQAPYPKDRCLHELFEEQAARTPEAIACQFGEQQLTYAQLNERANQLAHTLKQRGVGAGQAVGLYIERSLEMMVGLLGIQKSGAAYVPLDPAYPTERIRLSLEDAQVPLLITHSALLASLPQPHPPVLCLDRDGAEIARADGTNPMSGAAPEDRVYVMFTSGSTGRPKGVQVPHRAVVNLLTCMARELSMGPADVFPALASFAFDMCIPELYLALISGGRVLIGERQLAGNGEELAALLRATGASIVHATPTTWNLLLEVGFTGRGLKRVIGAEALPRDLCNRLLDADPSLYNFYGPTETTVWSTFHHFRSRDEVLTVGRPLANTQVYILDAQLQPVPIGVAGEVHIGGDGVTLGYLNRPELTAEKFIEDPFCGQPGRKMYRTGDRARYLADGRIEFQGRADHQVKVRGFRIELGDIEAALGDHPAVKECVVMAREDVAGDARLVGYVVAASSAAPSGAQLREWLASRLPDYMIPAAFVVLPRLPLSPNGKVDRKALPAPDYTRPELAREFMAASTPIEEVICGVWAAVLKLDRVGTRDNFFELGGHSLLATQVISRIRAAFEVELPLRALFEAPTVAGLAERVAQLQRERQGLDSGALVPIPRTGPLSLSFAQARLWFLDQLEPANPLYNVPYIVRLKGALNTRVLERALQEIVNRHEALRTHFATLNDEPVQVIAPTLSVPLVLEDLTGLPAAEREGAARERAMAEIKQPFNLASGPLIRARVIRLFAEDQVLILNTHHIISDRWSLGVLSQELAALYEAFCADRPSPLAPLPIQYADYAHWQREYLAGPALATQLKYWREQLSGAPAVLELPTDRPRSGIETFWGGIHRQEFTPELAQGLRTLSRRHGATMFMTLIAAFQTVLAHESGQRDIVVGTDLANRTQLATEKLIGFFVNLLPIRAHISDELTFEQLLQQMRHTALGAFAHQDVPFDKLVEELRPERSLTHHPLVQVLFVMQNTPQMTREFGGLKASPLGVGSTSRFDLVLFVNDPDGEPYATWMYNPNLFDSSSIARFATLYDTVLRAAVSDTSVSISALTQLLESASQEFRSAEQQRFQQASTRRLKDLKRRSARSP